MALADIHVKKPREAQIWNCCTGNPVLRILSDSNKKKKEACHPNGKDTLLLIHARVSEEGEPDASLRCEAACLCWPWRKRYWWT